MKVLVDLDRTAATQMARDHALFEAALAGEVGARIYEWDQVWVTLGRFQTPTDVFFDPNFAAWTLRETGGGAVLHGHDLTIGVAIPLTRQSSVRDVYRQLVSPIVDALRACGIDAALGEDVGFAERSKGAYCFLGRSQNDVVSVSMGQKLCGCALRVTREAALLQASIPLHQPIRPGSEIIRGAVRDTRATVDKARLRSQLIENFERLTS